MRPGLAYLFLAMSSQEPTRRCARAVQLSPTWRVRSGNHNAPVTAALHHWCSLSEACIDAHRAMTWLRVFFSIPCPGGRYAAAQGTGAGVRACSRSHLRQRTVREMAVSTFVRASETTCRNARSAVNVSLFTPWHAAATAHRRSRQPRSFEPKCACDAYVCHIVSVVKLIVWPRTVPAIVYSRSPHKSAYDYENRSPPLARDVICVLHPARVWPTERHVCARASVTHGRRWQFGVWR